jgi:hypothetical protein
MKTTHSAKGLPNRFFNRTLLSLVATMMVLSGSAIVQAQGTIVFNGQVGLYGTNYYESGMLFRVVIPTPGEPYHDGMVIIPPNTYNNVPYNATPFMGFFQQFSPDDYVSLSLTNGYTFGLTSVNLADPNAPSLSPVSISFIGFLASGSMVTNTFTTPGNGATNLLNYSFAPNFASGLTSVEIQSTQWAMDNLVFGNVVPEPGIGSLITVGLLAFAARKIRSR